MNLYLIDYENVTETGLSGTNELTADDHVIVFSVHRLRTFLLKSMSRLPSVLPLLNTSKFRKPARTISIFNYPPILDF